MTVTSAGRSTGNDKIARNGAGDAQNKERLQAVDAAILSIETQFNPRHSLLALLASARHSYGLPCNRSPFARGDSPPCC